MLGGTGPGERRSVRPLRWWAAGLGVLAVIATSVGAYFLLGAASEGVAGADTAATLRVEVLRTALSVGAGTAAAVALVLAWRRQWLMEHVAHDTSYDAAERRVTELYVKAVEQLGSEKAPVRMGGLYALERLAQDNPPQRQMIVEVMCAYLRMPFDPDDPGPFGLEERQVRLTAQRSLTRHLRPWLEWASKADPKFWPGMEIDLSGATLIDFRLRKAVVANSEFNGAVFHGRADFGRTRFTARAYFRGARFTDRVSFEGARFESFAAFADARFEAEAEFGECLLDGDTEFTRTSLAHPESFAVSMPPFDGRGGRHAWPPGWQLIRDPRDPSLRRLVAVYPPAEDG